MMTIVKKEGKASVTLSRRSLLKILLLLAASSPAIALVAPTFIQTSVPDVLSSVGYINRTPLASHTTSEFNSVGSSTIVAFVSSHPSWNSHSVNIVGLTDNLGNNWKLLGGPTAWAGSSFTLLSAIYYVNAPIGSDAHSVTVTLTNPAPLVVHVVAVSGGDITAPPLHSAIASLKVGEKSREVIANPLLVPDSTLLLGWAKNECSATPSPLDDFTLDQHSTGFLWSEYKKVRFAGSYTTHFRYDSAIGYQTALVAVRAADGPLASNQAVVTQSHTPMSIALKGFSPKVGPLAYSLVNGPLHGKLSGNAPNLTYTPETQYIGTDSIGFTVSDVTGVSNKAFVRIIVRPNTLFERLAENLGRLSVFSVISIGIIGAGLRSRSGTNLALWLKRT